METIQIEVFLPATDDTVEFLLPTGRPIAELLREMIRQITAVKMNICFDEQTTPCLCDMERRILLNPASTLAQSGVKNGARLLLC